MHGLYAGLGEVGSYAEIVAQESGGIDPCVVHMDEGEVVRQGALGEGDLLG